MEQSADINPTILSLREVGKFSKLILALEEGDEQLKPFVSQLCSIEGFERKIKERKRFPINRNLLVEGLQSQYEGIEISPEIRSNIERLSSENTFTVTTGHQLNIFTGPIYFHYIMYILKLSLRRYVITCRLIMYALIIVTLVGRIFFSFIW